MKLTYGQLELTLASHLQIHPDKVPTLRSRIKQLQRLQFPPGVNVGRGAKMEYSGEHLFMLVTAFELIGSGLPAQTVCNVVVDHWRHFAAGFALAALQERELGDEKRSQILAIVKMRSLHEIQFGLGWGGNVASNVEIRDVEAAKMEFHSSDHNRSFARLILSIGGLLVRVLKIARETSGVEKASIFDRDFHIWLPAGRMPGITFKGFYPDRSNIEMRQSLHQVFSNDPESLTPDGAEEAREFIENDFSRGFPF